MQKLYGALALALCVAIFPLYAARIPTQSQSFVDPIDAISFGNMDADTTLSIRSFIDEQWTEWQNVSLDDEQDPESRESELVMFRKPVTKIEVQSAITNIDFHPIRINHDPARYQLASLLALATPHILSRSEWGADDTLLYPQPIPEGEKKKEIEADEERGDNGGTATSSSRIRDCQEAYAKYGGEFAIERTVRSENNKKLLWERQYSKQIKLFAIHHTALTVRGDTRPAVERLRALYKYHASNRGWGDIGYHYVVDENGQIYEGRSGGDYVVAGHAYCNNIGTVGIALMGNFELEQPSQRQVAALKWLIDNLAKKYNVKTSDAVTFHGKQFSAPIVGHRDLVSTLCPGYYMYAAVGQVIKHIQGGHIDAPVLFPTKAIPGSSSVSSSSSSAPETGLRAQGRLTIATNPGGKQRITLTLTAGENGIHALSRIATLKRSTPALKLWQEDGAQLLPLTNELTLPYDLPGGDVATISILVQAPWDSGSFTFDIGSLHYTLEAHGRRSRVDSYVSPVKINPKLIVTPAKRVRPVARLKLPAPSSSSSRPSLSASSSSSRLSPARAGASSTPTVFQPGLIRIRLSPNDMPSLSFTNGGRIDRQNIAAGDILTLSATGSDCVVKKNDRIVVQKPMLRFVPDDDSVITIDRVRGSVSTFRGIIECQVASMNTHGKPVEKPMLAVINELPIEEYLLGLSEEPDSEPYEKQRAFAIAARTYAAYYMNPNNRKFPGTSYDGSDDPAIFQAYSGVRFETKNAQWLKALESTANQVLTFRGEIIKPPYFTADDGHTKSPEQAGWGNFPWAKEIFYAKSDPWCVGMKPAGHGVGMSGCGARAQAKEGKSAEQILQYYYPGTRIGELRY